jgi:acetaldehyde dehydrogenase/alcohol dehydrogenase
MLKKKAFIVPATFLYKNGYALPLTDKLDEMGIVHTTFFTTFRFVLLGAGLA